jgi:N-acetylmuramoyl-L-alanine amidase
MDKIIEALVFHCSDSGFGDVATIKDWHVQGNGWRDIGYNGVILNGFRKSTKAFASADDGLFEMGRGLDLDTVIEREEVGAHAKGFNDNSMGICLIGVSKFSIAQFQTAYNLVRLFRNIVPGVKLLGHYELPTAGGKTCPNFDMDVFREICEKDGVKIDASIVSRLLKS